MRSEIDYDIDGLVFAVKNIEVQEEAGWTGKCPNGKIAFKFKPEQTTTIIQGIEWQLGRTGKITPVAQIKAVNLAGSKIDSPTLHNFSQICLKNIAIGDEVLIEKAGDIIPQVVSVITKIGEDTENDVTTDWNVKTFVEALNYPFHCPVCGSNTKLDDKKINVWCINPNCKGQLEHRIHHYLKVIGVLNVGPANVHDMLENDIISSIADLYDFEERKIASLEGYGKRSASKIANEIHKKINIPLATFLASLGIHGLGKTTGKTIADKYETLENVMSVSISDLEKLEGIGETISQSIVSGIESMKEEINRLTKTLNIEDCIKVSGSLSSMSFCITGTLSMKRNEMAKIIENAGGIIKSSVSKGLDYLVAGEGVGKGKTDKAAKYGTVVISEDELNEMM